MRSMIGASPSRWYRLGASALAVVIAVACGSTPLIAMPDINALRCGSTPAVVPHPSSLPALMQVGAEERVPLHGVIVHSGHGRAGPEPPISVSGATERALASELRAAATIACELRTPADAKRAGYVLSAYFTQGVGTHWTNWNLVDAGFDPTRPSMLLYAPHLGVQELIGFSYWVRTAAPGGPDGFAGSADAWHRHYGMCFDRTGLLERENVKSPELCRDVYVNGADIWMLHAWVVPGAANTWGTFAPLNPQLCSRTVADIERCPGVGAP